MLFQFRSVCNGNYGDTEFHGVNEILVFGDTITASVAKLNEFYLSRSTGARRQYTMCHEIGHGFGLPHSDENFFNLNLGNWYVSPEFFVLQKRGQLVDSLHL